MQPMKQISKKLKIIEKLIASVITVAILSTFDAGAQILDFQNKLSIPLDDGTTITLYGKAKKLSNEFTGEYYYLPANLRLSKRPDGTPEFLFLKYTTEERTDAGGVQGALMHFLMEWGLTAEQESALEGKLEEKIKDIVKSSSNSPFQNVIKPKVMGPVNILSGTEDSFQIISATLTSDKFTPNLVKTGTASNVPGAKMAVASILEKNGAQLLAATFEKNRSIADVSINLRFRYEVLAPKINGKITVDWKKFSSLYDQSSRDYTHRDEDDETLPGGNGLGDDIITDSEFGTLISEMRETNIVKVELDIGEVDNPIAQKVVEVFMEFIISSISDKELEGFKPATASEDEEENPYEPSSSLYKYSINKFKFEQKRARNTEIYNLNVRLPIEQEVTITENLASWYDHVKHNPKCVAAINLNDPFFQHRDIHFILDLEATEMFDQEVNYVTINTRKRRSSGNDFADRVTIDKKFVEENGINASMTYARGDDNNPDAYEYQTQWSLRGGKVFPDNPQWLKGQWEGVTLKPPVMPRKIEFEANIEELKDMDITRATLQIRYKKFGREVESNLHLSPVRQEQITSQMLFMDRDTKGYVYRLVFNHKTEGKLVLDWSSKINDNYVYAVIPNQLKDKTSKIFAKAKETARVVLDDTNADGTVKTKGKVLDRFKEVLDVVLKN